MSVGRRRQSRDPARPQSRHIGDATGQLSWIRTGNAERTTHVLVTAQRIRFLRLGASAHRRARCFAAPAMRVRCIAAFIGVSPATVSLAPQNKLKKPSPRGRKCKTPRDRRPLTPRQARRIRRERRRRWRRPAGWLTYPYRDRCSFSRRPCRHRAASCRPKRRWQRCRRR